MMDVDWSRVELPDTEEPLFKPFWEGTRESELRVQVCDDCDRYRWPPRPLCVGCGSGAVRWLAVEPLGTLHSWVVVAQSFTKGFDDVPYVVGLIELHSDPPLRFLGNVVDVRADDLDMGMELKARFVPVTAALSLVYWGRRDA